MASNKRIFFFPIWSIYSRGWMLSDVGMSIALAKIDKCGYGVHYSQWQGKSRIRVTELCLCTYMCSYIGVYYLGYRPVENTSMPKANCFDSIPHMRSFVSVNPQAKIVARSLYSFLSIGTLPRHWAECRTQLPVVSAQSFLPSGVVRQRKATYRRSSIFYLF